ncbi:Mur ligase family protein [Patescibacteria group bacterium]|nr:Mur ligase family protein [Patescibacteria group bacterium]
MKSIKKLFAGFLLEYLRIAAKLQMKKVNPKIIGVGGSSGKSSLCSIIAHHSRYEYKIKQGGGKNSETGIPLDILGISPGGYTAFDWVRVALLVLYKLIFDWEKYDFYIAEMGIDGPEEPKNMSYLLKIIKPDIGVLTNISFEHSVYFDSLVSKQGLERESKILELTANQELMLLKSARKNTVLNIDDKEINTAKENIKSKKITVSALDSKADFHIKNIKSNLDNFQFELTNKSKKYSVKINKALPSHYASSIAMAIAIAGEFKLDIDKTIAFLKDSITLPPGRMSVFKGLKNTILIDSSYNNATLTPIVDLLDFLKNLPGKERKVVIIGDMRELGSMSKKLHVIVARKIAETADFAILIGPMMQDYAAPILKEKMVNHASFKTFSEAKDYILKNIRTNDVILVKSSQNALFLERVVQMLLADSKDEAKLCRRGNFWDKRRQETP